MDDADCTHLGTLREVAPRTPAGCEDCLRMGSRWVHLRLCLSCGHVGCCNSSPHRHATRHFLDTGHPLVRSFEPGEAWGWCYVDERLLSPSTLRAALLSRQGVEGAAPSPS
jgi:uncharacterized UBP type Zn finger protein